MGRRRGFVSEWGEEIVEGTSFIDVEFIPNGDALLDVDLCERRDSNGRECFFEVEGKSVVRVDAVAKL